MRHQPITHDFTMAFQPIVDTASEGRIFAYEALLRGSGGEGADEVFAAVGDAERIAFDAACRERAVEMAAAFGMRCKLSLNVSAAAFCDYRYGIHATLNAAKRLNWPLGRLIFELTEHDPIDDSIRLSRWIAAARNRGVTVAMDDFGSGYAGINMLLRLRPGIVKLDKELVHDIDGDVSRQAIVKGMVEACAVFGSRIVAEGVETRGEFAALVSLGVELMQGYLFAQPGLACLPEIVRTTSVTINDRGCRPYRPHPHSGEWRDRGEWRERPSAAVGKRPQ